ncbi:biotin/lipoyl-binding protein [Thermoleophilia bacterium SCSIO 60948]|nr:biotin/lipoyl-binding protein [Thermoleophilia bacterium SCSIO 60948]
MTKLLVANRGEIARRIFRTCTEMGIATVAVFSEPDRNAPFVREADEAVALGGATPAESYLRGDAIVAAARRTGSDAVHPGYGFLAENAAFARACGDAAITFVGPTPDAIEAMGSKLQAKRRMEAAGVPVVPGRDVTGLDGADLQAAAERVGFPLLAKASAGGGGKGMRIVRSPDELQSAVAAARREAAGAFGDDALMLERYVERGRHVEIQIFGDGHGNVVSLHERDCSIQRRHQKVIEESPSPALSDDLRARMSDAAVAAGEALGYVNAGTVEFLLAPDGEFFFLEVNTRLQVEHPVTELVTGLDLVRLQLMIAEGQPLPHEAGTAQLRGHAIEARLYAEDPTAGFLPQTGRVTRFAVPDGVRVDAGVESGSQITVHYDPMIAKVIAHAPTRTEAARLLSDALRRTEVHGVATNRDLLVRVLAHDEFLAGEADTSFLERHDPARLSAPLPDTGDEALHAAAAALAGQAERRAAARALRTFPSGWRNNPSQPQETRFEGARGSLDVQYELERDGNVILLRVNDEELPSPRLTTRRADLVELEIEGLRRSYRLRRDGAIWWINGPEGQSALRELDRFPDTGGDAQTGSLTSPMPGTVVRLLTPAGAQVERGAPLLVIEAMKMEHEIVAPVAGTVANLHVEQGAQVDAGAVLAVIEEDGASPS